MQTPAAEQLSGRICAWAVALPEAQNSIGIWQCVEAIIASKAVQRYAGLLEVAGHTLSAVMGV